MVRKYFIIFSLLSVVLNGVLLEPAFVTLKSRLIDWGYQQKVKGEVSELAALPETRSIEDLLKVNLPNVEGIN